jgi:hypothetical protein
LNLQVHQLFYHLIIDTQQITELLLAMREEMRERMDANTKVMNEK